MSEIEKNGAGKRKSPDFGRLRNLSTSAYGVKVLIIVILLLCFQLPLEMIRSTVSERQWRRAEVEGQILDTRGGSVVVGGPVMVVPRIKSVPVLDEKGKQISTKSVRSHIYILPESLQIQGFTDSSVKERGIYSVPVYSLLVKGRGSFFPGETLKEYDPAEILWDDITIQFSYPQLKGMKNIQPLLWNGRESSFRPGSRGQGIYSGVISASVSLEDWAGASYPFQYSQEIQGGESLSFLPLAGNTLVTLQSDWTSPSFNGYYLPGDSRIAEDGFTAEWQINALSRNIPRSWEGDDNDTFDRIRESAFGLRFFPVVTSYDKIHRTLKYSFLFLVLPFLTFFLFELIRKVRIHPVQYILAGAGNIMFYLLLLSLSEHIPFEGAYLTAALAVVVMLTWYALLLLKKWRSGITMFPVMALSYGYMYFVLQSEDYALLLGSLGLFGAVTLLMFLTRKVDWYGGRQ